MLRDAVKRFGEDLKKISEIITTKSMYGLCANTSCFICLISTTQKLIITILDNH